MSEAPHVAVAASELDACTNDMCSEVRVEGSAFRVQVRHRLWTPARAAKFWCRVQGSGLEVQRFCVRGARVSTRGAG